MFVETRILLENYFLPGDLERQVAAFVDHYNRRMKQAALFDGFAFDRFLFQHDDVAAPEVDVGVCEIAETLVVAAMGPSAV
jgi:hypothetical protein